MFEVQFHPQTCLATTLRCKLLEKLPSVAVSLAKSRIRLILGSLGFIFDGARIRNSYGRTNTIPYMRYLFLHCFNVFT